MRKKHAKRLENYSKHVEHLGYLRTLKSGDYVTYDQDQPISMYE